MKPRSDEAVTRGSAGNSISTGAGMILCWRCGGRARQTAAVLYALASSRSFKWVLFGCAMPILLGVSVLVSFPAAFAPLCEALYSQRECRGPEMYGAAIVAANRKCTGASALIASRF